MIGQTYSQAGQDLWVLETLGFKHNGTFLDIGCHDPISINNTFLLERDYDWTGIAVDIDPKWKIEWRIGRHFSEFIAQDSITADWELICEPFDHEFDYLSLDVDEAQLLTVSRFPWHKIRFKVMTIEHDCYKLGDDMKNCIRSILDAHGYKLARPDVIAPAHGVKFEDWWVSAQMTTKNDVVTIYKDPYTKTIPEGKAALICRIFDDHDSGLSKWLVEFVDSKLRAERYVLNATSK